LKIIFNTCIIKTVNKFRKGVGRGRIEKGVFFLTDVVIYTYQTKFISFVPEHFFLCVMMEKREQARKEE
jgi:hypothetical protein